MLSSVSTRLRQAVARYLLSAFRGTERLDKDAILSTLSDVMGKRLLDCGSGDESFTLELGAEISAESIYGIEKDSERAETAMARGIKVLSADLNSRLPYSEGVFDVVHLNQVIEHLVDTDAFIKEPRRVLKPGGIAILSTNSLSSWHNVLSLALRMQPPPMHVSSEVITGNPLDPLEGSHHPSPGDSHLRLFAIGAFGRGANITTCASLTTAPLATTHYPLSSPSGRPKSTLKHSPNVPPCRAGPLTRRRLVGPALCRR